MKKQKKRFSMKNKLLIVFGLLIFIAGITLSLFAIRVARRAVMEKIEIHLKDKATDTAEIIDGRIMAMFQFLEGVSRMPQILDQSVSYQTKTDILIKEAKFNPALEDLYIVDITGIQFYSNGKQEDYSKTYWFQEALKKKKIITEPYKGTYNEKIFITFSLPVYDDSNNIIGVLGADILAKQLSDQIDDIVVGQTGECYILDKSGSTVADKDFSLVETRSNAYEESKTDPALESCGLFEKMAVEMKKPSVGYFEYKSVKKIASYAKMKNTDWTVIVDAPIEEFMGTIAELRLEMIIIGLGILALSLIIIFIVAHRMIKPISLVVRALKNIAQGEGDLTVRLPLVGNDEITDLSEYFNQTISKIGSSIKTIGENSNEMTNIGTELASNMTETASAVHQISANIDGVKQQALTQSASVTETASTVEEIIRTIKQLNGSIENQAASVAESSSAIEQMVSNIASITQTLDKTNDVVKKLASATADGKETIGEANNVTQRIAEESGGLLEASNVIQHIASQTNLLAMNAAIEAAHAGEAGKGFAVVADEIRKLAEESSTQGKTITSTLKVLSGEIEALSASAKTAEEKFNAIFALSEQVKTMSQNLMDAMREQENGSKEVLSAIRDINMVTSQVNDGSAEMLKGGENVAQEMRKLDELTRIITDSMNEMASGAVQISNAVQDVNEISKKNKHSIENLSTEVGKFKV
ncbi:MULTISPECIES: methyl-accepting chemotaxis protein [unclassified Treponema]|uniref:methyl-accepting chemotaxis protein n=1 Tax=unclassified Treponema TaxID=2638727 RepID=UPI0020A42765|nr:MULTISPECIES: methyl-accepting chemotaxis protein [unclassified Treponema]UTC67485.1 methyl-accepting chemotaxis protein [Treponema sp. OMZ 789]UTC70213.1 methyl-accepting chemotaxis protein [Treponema sp. OMZ 790]UTC72928.1 methyl-accepting chemotaxis protein [Treponema sp. OMZ 791]